MGGRGVGVAICARGGECAFQLRQKNKNKLSITFFLGYSVVRLFLMLYDPWLI